MTQRERADVVALINTALVAAVTMWALIYWDVTGWLVVLWAVVFTACGVIQVRQLLRTRRR